MTNGHGGEQSDSGDELTIDVLRAEVRSLTELIRETQARLAMAERERDALAEMFRTLCEATGRKP